MMTFVNDNVTIPIYQAIRVVVPGKGLQHADIDEAFPSLLFMIEDPDLIFLEICKLKQLFFPLVGKLLSMHEDEGWEFTLRNECAGYNGFPAPGGATSTPTQRRTERADACF